MRHLRLRLASQTPFVRFFTPTSRTTLTGLVEGQDYQLSPGGVTRMLHALSTELVARRRIQSVDWTALAPGNPPTLQLSPGIRLHHVGLPPAALREYAEAKADVWNAVHGLRDPPESFGPIERGLDAFARAVARRATTPRPEARSDLVYVHDFQLLTTSRHLPAGVPRVFRWHIPVPTEPEILAWIARWMNTYDAVVVSTHAYAARLRRAGVRVPIHAAYPYIDENLRRAVTADEVAAFESRWGLAPGDPAFLLVGRMDPIKSQDLALRAFARVARDRPDARLLLVGGRGFSGGRRGGLGLSHGDRWLGHLVGLARELGVERHAIFTGNLADTDLEVAYARARAVLLPSQLEGFGLVALEAWVRGIPVIASRGAGVAELVRQGRNGFAFDPGDEDTLAEAMGKLADDAGLAFRLGAVGRATAAQCHRSVGAAGVWSILQGARDARARSAPPP